MDSAFLETEYQSDNELVATVPASTFAVTGTHRVAVFRRCVPTQWSNEWTLTVVNPRPGRFMLEPTSVGRESSRQLTLTGSQFVAPATVLLDRLDGMAIPTTFVSASRLDFVLPESVGAGDYVVYVQNPGPGGGVGPGEWLHVE